MKITMPMLYVHHRPRRWLRAVCHEV